MASNLIRQVRIRALFKKSHMSKNGAFDTLWSMYTERQNGTYISILCEVIVTLNI